MAFFGKSLHAEIEITLICAGQGVCVIGDQFEPYQAGDGFVIGGELPHTWASQGPGPHRAVVLQVHPRILQGLYSSNCMVCER